MARSTPKKPDAPKKEPRQRKPRAEKQPKAEEQPEPKTEETPAEPTTTTGSDAPAITTEEPTVADNPAAPQDIPTFLGDYYKTHDAEGNLLDQPDQTPPLSLSDGVPPGPGAELTEEDFAAAMEILERDPIVQMKGNFDYSGNAKLRPEGPAWERADEMFEFGERLPPVEESDAFRKEFRLSAEEWREIRDFYLHPRDTGDSVHRGRPVPISRFQTRATPEGPAPTGGFSAGLGFYVDWQNGNEQANGAIIEDILEYAIIPRLEFFQASRFASMETGLAIKHLRDAVAALDLRVQRRKQAGTYGTYKE